VLLPDVEEGNPILIGATVHNPFFSLASPLLSRSLVCELKALKEKEILAILEAGLSDKNRGLGSLKIKIEKKALNFIARTCEGDARRALNALEVGVLTTPKPKDGPLNFDLAVAQESIQKKAVVYDHDEDGHYDTASAFIKSMRGSDPDAALYWMAKMLYAGEDPRFIARRICILAAEDVGNADPLALVLANAALQIAEFVGMPEARIPLAQACIYVSCAAKSNAGYLAIEKAMADIESDKVQEVPDHLKDSHADEERLGHGKDYKYAHDFPGHYVKQKYTRRKVKYYEPAEIGFEAKIKQRLANLGKTGVLLAALFFMAGNARASSDDEFGVFNTSSKYYTETISPATSLPQERARPRDFGPDYSGATAAIPIAPPDYYLSQGNLDTSGGAQAPPLQAQKDFSQPQLTADYFSRLPQQDLASGATAQNIYAPYQAGVSGPAPAPGITREINYPPNVTADYSPVQSRIPDAENRAVSPARPLPRREDFSLGQPAQEAVSAPAGFMPPDTLQAGYTESFLLIARMYDILFQDDAEPMSRGIFDYTDPGLALKINFPAQEDDSLRINASWGENCGFNIEMKTAGLPRMYAWYRLPDGSLESREIAGQRAKEEILPELRQLCQSHKYEISPQVYQRIIQIEDSN
jgi:replication-associated recombination protein RarA